jgi:phosphatidylglycerophosphatase A
MTALEKVYTLLSTSLGLGLIPRLGPIPRMSGTWGALLGVFIHMGIYFSQFPERFRYIMLVALGIVCIVSIPLGYWAEKRWGKDPRKFTLDEVAGYLLTATFFTTGNLITTIFWAFVISRFFDILKPPPVKMAERFPAGWGILLDDIVASVYAVLLLNIINYCYPGFLALAWLPLPPWLQPVQ